MEGEETGGRRWLEREGGLKNRVEKGEGGREGGRGAGEEGKGIPGGLPYL